MGLIAADTRSKSPEKYKNDLKGKMFAPQGQPP